MEVFKNIPNVGMSSLQDKISYSIGHHVGMTLKKDGFEEIDLDIFTKAIQDVFDNKRPLLHPQEMQQVVHMHIQEVMEEKGKRNLLKGRDFLANNSKKKGVISLPSGLQYTVKSEGKGGRTPTLDDTVVVHYEGKLLNGALFDSSRHRGQPAAISLKQVIRGWQDALVLMTVGAKWQLFIPSNLAYGQHGMPPQIEPYSTLIMEVELLEIQ